MRTVKIGTKEFELEDKDAALIEAILILVRKMGYKSL